VVVASEKSWKMNQMCVESLLLLNLLNILLVIVECLEALFVLRMFGSRRTEIKCTLKSLLILSSTQIKNNSFCWKPSTSKPSEHSTIDIMFGSTFCYQNVWKLWIKWNLECLEVIYTNKTAFLYYAFHNFMFLFYMRSLPVSCKGLSMNFLENL